MPVQEFALDAVGNYVQVFWGDESEKVTVLFNRSVLGIIPNREELRAGSEFALPDGSTVSVQLVETQLHVLTEGRLLPRLSTATPSMEGQQTGSDLLVCLGHHVDNPGEPVPEGSLVRSGKDLYRVQSLTIARPKAGQTEVQVRCIYCGEDVPLKVLSRSSQGTRVGFFISAFVFLPIGGIAFLFSIGDLLFHLDPHVEVLGFAASLVVLICLYVALLLALRFSRTLLLSRMDTLTPPVSLKGHSTRHRVLKSKRKQNKGIEQ